MKFPQYRKYKNDLSYFKISDQNNFTEWKKYGKNWQKVEFVAKILPDRNYIHDMLNDFELYWDEVSQEDFQKFLRSIES